MEAETANSGPPQAALAPLELTGRARSHVVLMSECGCELHPRAAAALRALRAAAAHDGIDLQAVSGFRDFNRQLAIWNGKFRGTRVLLDADSRPLDAADLDEAQRVAAILVWTALPGASRHHWGSDCDVIDRAALGPGAAVELLSADYAAGGRYARLSRWLGAHAHAHGFFLPYDRYRGGVQPEPWHLSYAPVAGPALAALDVTRLREALAGAELDGRASVEARLAEIYDRYVATVAPAPPAALAARTLLAAAR
ncbi:MAG: M15 family metallopeptidase [Gammaproteobacteria bacterium]|nr:M15 family metallopeptidase [Gammaproteobacteria bacterium]MDE2251541.1 M15 family metallopeptidase [Gammaproteobacteria bacterium]